ncbi:hypothetical protein ANCCEY_04945 [Ancylostoma ceylanicum]|uniref:Reverse transcriptase domain-containing protein n=1 Tax=Ancylostoma ceylanicum TaxID=53326 RepID=A0A0D6LV89_9BILA|nr:hypothetical protein ANCCEY_04945 [Ancylostoma ceylanicum]
MFRDDDITIRRGVRQGDTMSPKLFTATLEDVMQRSGSQHGERPRSRAGQEEASGLKSLQEHRGRSEEDGEH